MQTMADRRELEIRLVEGEPPTRDDDDITGVTWRPGTPDQYELRLLEYTGTGPAEKFRVSQEPPPQLFHSRRAALEAAERLKAEDPSLADVPIVDISPDAGS